jgi:predicted DNA-binding transcriptional regulator AlpA
MHPILLKAHEAAQMLGISERAFHTLRHQDGFPQPVTLGERAVRWRTSEIATWTAGLPTERNRAEPPQLAGTKKRRNAAETVREQVAA